MTQKTSETVIRKLPLPLQIRVGNDTVVTDGFFTLTSKETSQIKIVEIGQDGYATCEIFPPLKERTISLQVTVGEDVLIGMESSKTRGRGKDFGQYKYFRQPNGNLYAMIFGGTGRPYKFQLGKLSDRNSPLSVVARTIARNLNTSEFTRKQLIPLIPKNLQFAQSLKAILDVMHLEGFLDKESKRNGRLKESYKATDKLKKLIVASSEQA